MKKWFVFFYAFFTVSILSFFILYTLKLDKVTKEKEKQEETKKELEGITKYIKNNKIGETIKIKMTSSGEVKEITINDYLKGVLPAEMPPEYDMEALKAQAVVARTYLYQKMTNGSHGDADICDSASHCQAYYDLDGLFRIWKRSKGYTEEECKSYFAKVSEAVDSTENIVVTYEGKYIRAYFHACSGGKTENVSAIWGKQNIPYLKSVESLGEEDYKNYKSTVKLSISELASKLNNATEIKCNISLADEDNIKIVSYTQTGRVDKILIGGEIYTAEKLRTVLGLKSTNFTVSFNDDKVIFNVIGYGHGVGMSQVGANYYAKIGYTFDKIISHYYTNVDITYLYEEEETNENKV